MAGPDIFSRLLALPEPVQDYIFSEESGTLNGEIISRNGLSEGQLPVLFDLLKELFVQDIQAEGLEGEVRQRFGLDAEKSRKLALDIAGYRLLPLDKYLGNIDALISRLGGKPADYPLTRIKIEQREVGQAVDEVVGAIGTDPVVAKLKQRLRDISKSFLEGVRTEKQVMDVLQKSDKVGGMGLSDEAARRVMEELVEEAKTVVIKPAKEEPAPPAPPAAQTSEEKPPAAPPVKKPDDFATIKPEDEKEIEQFKSTVLPARGAESAAETAEKISRSIEEIYGRSGPAPADEVMQKRLKMIIGNRLRDIRDSMETLETLVQPKELGGMALSQEDGRKLLALIDGKLKEVHEAHRAAVETEKAEWLKGEEAAKAQKEVLAQLKEKTELDSLYQDIAGKTKKARTGTQPQPPVYAPAAAVPMQAAQVGQSSKAPPPNLPVVPSAPRPPVAAPSMPIQPSPARAATAVPPAIPRPVEPPAAAPPPPPVAAARMPPAPPPISVMRPPQTPPAPAARPKIEDVKFVAKLTGPVEELRAITVVDFRRLSKDPKEACDKIRVKLDLLRDESFEKRTEGLKAWNESEVFRTYLEQMREALDGKPMPEVTAARQAAGRPYLAPEEVKALAELSRKLRY